MKKTVFIIWILALTVLCGCDYVLVMQIETENISVVKCIDEDGNGCDMTAVDGVSIEILISERDREEWYVFVTVDRGKDIQSVIIEDAYLYNAEGKCLMFEQKPIREKGQDSVILGAFSTENLTFEEGDRIQLAFNVVIEREHKLFTATYLYEGKARFYRYPAGLMSI